MSVPKFHVNLPVFAAQENIPTRHPRQRTLIVLGTMRGGTSMIAAVLDALGVYMGECDELKRGGAFESSAFMGSDPAVREAEAERCNALHDVWGFKNPKGANVLGWLPTAVCNPYGIVVYRDAVAVAQRWQEKRSEFASLPFHVILDTVLAEQQRLSDALTARPAMPTLWLSYERSRSDARLLVRSIIDFTGIQPAELQIEEAASRVSPTEGYFNDAN